MAGPLAGIKAIDFGRAAVGPVALSWLAHLGADVIKVEPPEGDGVRGQGGPPAMQGMGTTFMGNNVGKRGIVLNLKDPADKEVALKLVAVADVAIDNFRSNEVMVRLGMGYDVLSKINPRLVYVQSSAYGNKGPLKGTSTGEWSVQAYSGYTSVVGKPGGRAEFNRGTANLDWNGAMVNAQALLVALYMREKTGKGVFIETNQGQAGITLGSTRIAEYFATGTPPAPMGSGRPNIVPDQAFSTLDGYINLTVIHDGFWPKLCKAINRADLMEEPRFSTNQLRVENREELIPMLEQVFRGKSSAEWLYILKKHDVPCGEYFQDRLLSHNLMDQEQVRSNNLLQKVDTPWGKMNSTNAHWNFSKTPAGTSRSAPELDQHHDEIIADWLK